MTEMGVKVAIIKYGYVMGDGDVIDNQVVARCEDVKAAKNKLYHILKQTGEPKSAYFLEKQLNCGSDDWESIEGSEIIF